MGYHIEWHGDLAFSGAAFTAADIKKLPKFNDSEYRFFDITTGDITVAYEGSRDQDAVKELLIRLFETFPDRKFEGDFRWTGDDGMDIGELRIKDNVIEEFVTFTAMVPVEKHDVVSKLVRDYLNSDMQELIDEKVSGD